MNTDQSDKSLDKPAASSGLPPVSPVQTPAPKPKPAVATYTPGEVTDKYRGHGGDYVIDEKGHRVPAPKK